MTSGTFPVETIYLAEKGSASCLPFNASDLSVAIVLLLYFIYQGIDSHKDLPYILQGCS